MYNAPATTPLRSRTALNPLLFCIAGGLYASVLSNLGRHPLILGSASGLSLTFNSMAEHLIRGQFDVDPSTVGVEGFCAEGHIVAYWGILPALLRLPLVLIPAGATIDVTGFSCFAAICIAAFAKFATLNCVFRHGDCDRHWSTTYWVLCLTILFGGPQIEFLSVSLYQEVCLWAGACASIFVYCVVKGLVLGRFTNGLLIYLASTAGLALLTRVSTAIGLCVALLLLLVVLHISERPRSVRLVAPGAVLGFFFALAAFVNWQRWGNPLTFANYHLYLYNTIYPDRLVRLARYGLFNAERIPFGLVYYFFPVWFMHRAGGGLLFQDFQTRVIDSTELPPGSFFLTDLLLMFFFCYAVRYVVRLPSLPRSPNSVTARFRLQASVIAAGLAVPGMLMLCAISMAFRYRIDFYPLLEFGAFIGTFGFLRTGARSRIPHYWLIAMATLGILCSYATLAVYELSALGPPIYDLDHGLVAYYERRLHDRAERDH